MREDIKERIEMIKRCKVPEGYKATKLGIIPKDWNVIQIKDCLERVDNPVEVEPDEEYTQIGIRSHGKGLFYKEAVKGRELGNKRVFWIEPDCFVVNIVFAWEQAVGRTSKDEVGMIASHRFPMYKPVENRVTIDYLVQYFLTPKGKEIMEYASPGGAGRNKTLGQDRFMKSYIVCPSYSEQDKIAEIMKQCNEMISAQENLIEGKRNEKKWLMQNLLTGKKRLPGFEPEWKQIYLNQIATIITERNSTNNTNVLTISAQYGLVSQREFFYKEVASENKENYYLLRRDDFAYNRSYSEKYAYGATKRLKEYDIGIVSPLYICFRITDKGISLDFLEQYYEVGIPNKDIRNVAQEGARNHGLLNISTKDYLNIKLILPDIKEQKAIAQVLSTADKEIELLEKQLELIKLEKKALMQLLLTGIVRVNEN